VGSSQAVAPGNDAFAEALCPAGKVAGGGLNMSGQVGVEWISSGPGKNGTAWQVQASNDTTGNVVVTAYAICLTTEPGVVLAFKGAKKAR
jgi:hypothetical protein